MTPLPCDGAVSSGECLDPERTTTGSSSMGIVGGVMGAEESVGDESSVSIEESDASEERRDIDTRVGRGCAMRTWGRERVPLSDKSASWCTRMSSSVIRSSKSSTSRNSRSIRPTSRLLNNPVQRDQCTFFRVESFKYCERDTK